MKSPVCRLVALVVGTALTMTSACDTAPEPVVETVESALVPTPTPPSLSRAIIVLHVDPQSASLPNWRKLTRLVAAADARGHRLTLLFGAPWGGLVESSMQRKLKVAQWLADGHQIGFHHHDCSHAVPDGYIAAELLSRHDAGEEVCSAAFTGAAGDVSDAYAEIKGFDSWLFTLAGVAETPRVSINLAAQGGLGDTALFRSWEWQQDNVFATGSVADNPFGAGGDVFLTAPSCKAYSDDGYAMNEWPVAEIGHQQLAIGAHAESSDGTLATLDAELASVFTPGGTNFRAGAYVGIVFHASEYDTAAVRADGSVVDDAATIEAMFDLVADYTTAVTANSVLLAAAPCAGL